MMGTVEEQAVRFRNGWPCRQCGILTEHKKVRGVQVCMVCGTPMREPCDVKAKQRAYNQRPDVKAKQRAYRQRPDVKAKQRAYQRQYRKKMKGLKE
jgi:hypothetical protein